MKLFVLGIENKKIYSIIKLIMIINKEVVFIRNTKQKELIMQILSNDKSHPSIKDIYKKVRVIDERIGQATVYRNINQLVNMGKIKKISINGDCFHYDSNLNNHCHFVCKSCNQIIDIFDEELYECIKNVSQNHHVTVEEYEVIFRGYCEKCKKLLRGDS